MQTWQNVKKKNCLKNVRKVFMPTPLNDERAILVSYMYRGDGRRNFDAAGEGSREKFIFSSFTRILPNRPPPPKMI